MSRIGKQRGMLAGLAIKAKQAIIAARADLETQVDAVIAGYGLNPHRAFFDLIRVAWPTPSASRRSPPAWLYS